VRAGGPRIEFLDNVQYGLHYAVVCQNKGVPTTSIA